MKKGTIIFIALTVLLSVSAFYIVENAIDVPFIEVPFIKKEQIWSIGIYKSKDPFNFNLAENSSNPALTASDITDVPAKYVADPFMVHDNNTWYLFFEILNSSSSQGDIGVATSENGLKWEYSQVVLDEPFHLSYPYVFKWKDKYYMIPESNGASAIRLYKAENFPFKWVYIKELINGNYEDPSILYHDGMWWLFTLLHEGFDTLTLHYAENLEGPWTEHPESPIISKDKNISLSGGRMISYKGRIIRFTQDGDPTYGNQVRAFEIDELTTTTYKEHEIDESPIVKASGKGWNADGMHHIDPHKISDGNWISCVDGLSSWRYVFDRNFFY